MRRRQPPKALCNMQNQSDRLSNLPSHIVDGILSWLSIRDAVRTSILSSNWRYKWASLPNLIFDKDCCPSNDQAIAKSKLVNIIDQVLVLHTGIIQKFKLSHKDLQAVADIDRWILYVSRSPIEEFVLEIWKGQRYKMPSSLYSCKHLLHLELFNCLLNPPPVFKGFPNLRSLDLQHITMTEDAFNNLIVWCPSLERLTLMNFEGFFNLKINAPNLQFFDIGGDFEDVTFENTNMLAIISIGLYINVETEFNGRQNHPSNMLSFFACVPHIQRLEVQSYFLKARYEEESIAKTGTTFWEEKLQVECVFHQLRVVRIIDICATKPELDFVKFLLANSPVLEKLTVKPNSADGGLELLKELVRYKRASVQAEVIYMDT